MTCPECNHTASSWMRNSFSLQGVTLSQSLRGELKCQHCGVLLRNIRYSRHLWYSMIGTIGVLVLIGLFSNDLYFSFGTAGLVVYWTVLVLGVTLVFVYGMWKYAILEKVADKQ